MEAITIRIRGGKIVEPMLRIDPETKLRAVFGVGAEDLAAKIYEDKYRREEHVEQVAYDGRRDPEIVAAL